MECRQCASALERPGDYCLVCRSANADTAVLDCGRERATVSCLLEEAVVAERTITTEPEEEGRWATTELRNYAGRVADEVRRKRPEEVYAAGDREVLSSVRAELHYPFYRVRDDDPIEAVRERRGEPALETVADHPHVKKIIPGPIDAGGSGSRTGVRAKATRADGTGNVRLLVRDGSSVQENRVVTTAGDRKLGEHVRADLNDALAEAGFRE